MIKNISLLFLIIALSYQVQSQKIKLDTAEYPYWIDMMQDPKANFFETQKAFERYWDGREREKGDGWKPFKRWEYYMSQRIDAEGNKPLPGNELKEYQRYFGTGNKSVKSNVGHWSEIGPVNLPNNGTGQPNGLGRLNCVAFHPTNSNVIYVGSPAGGLWVTSNGGSSWKSITDTLPSLGVSAIIVDYSDPNVIYIGTGDRDASDSPGLGVWKSIDAGETWFVSNSGMGNRTVGKMIMNPNDSMTLLAATSSGIYKSTDGGQSWLRKSSNSNKYKDIVYKPGDTSIVYATETGDFYRSADGGNTWNKITSGIPTSNRLVIGVSPANVNYVYAVLTNTRTFKGLYRSTNSGQTFTLQSSTPNIMDYSSSGSGTGGQAWYDLDVVVDPTNVNIIYVGGINIFKSTNGGVSWTINAHWVGSGGAPDIHADQHELVVCPLNNRIYCANDGGLYYTSNGGSTWNDISNGLAIAQIYKIGQSAQSRNLVINGYQDNGTSIYDGNWRTEIGGDGMECIIDPVDSNFMYGELYYGDIRRSNNYGIWFSRISNPITEKGEWVTPYVLRESNSNTMFAGYKNLWRSTNVKTSSTSSVAWTKISNSLAGTNSQGMRVLENSPADDNILYIAREDKKLFRSDNINATTPNYTNISSALPTSAWPLDIEAHPFNSNKVYIVISKKVYESSNKGASWTNISGTLPNVNMNCIVYDSSSNGDLYVGSDLGIFFKGSWMSDWIPFSGGLPVAIDVTELEIYYGTDKSQSRIKAATYGRGLWSSPLYVKPIAAFGADENHICIGQNVQFRDSSEGFYTNVQWSFSGGNPSSSNLSNPSVTYSNIGTYTVSMIISNNSESDQLIKTNYIVVDSIPLISINPTAVTINQGDSTVLTASGATTYTWSPISGLNKFKGAVVKASPSHTTKYTVDGTNTFCSASSGQAQTTVTVIPTGIEKGHFESGYINVYPNPAGEYVTVDFIDVSTGIKTLYLTDLTGRRIFETEISINNTNQSINIDVSAQKDGYYFLQVKGKNEVIIFKVLVDHSF